MTRGCSETRAGCWNPSRNEVYTEPRDNLISDFIAAAIFIAFVGGLAVSIGVVPFTIIVVGLMLFDYYLLARDGLGGGTGSERLNRHLNY